MWKWFIVPLLLTILLVPTTVLADTSAEVTITAVGYIVGAPSGLTLTYVSDYEVGISWTKGEGAENTMIRACVGRTPGSRTDGYLVYYGTGTSASDTGVSLDETATPVYYRAWSESAGGLWEEEGISSFLEGVGVTILAISIIVLGLTIAAFVFKNAPLLLAGSMGWLVFAFLMYGKVFDNEALNTAFLMFGGAMALLCLFAAIGFWTSSRRRPPPEDEQEAYRREVLRTTRRR